MAITAIIDKVIQDPDATVIVVTYTDGVSFKTQKEYRLNSFTLDSFKSGIQQQIDSFTQVVDAPTKIPLGAFDPSPALPTIDQQKRIDYANALRLFGQMNRAITVGVKTSTDKDYTDLAALLQSDFIDSYISLF